MSNINIQMVKNLRARSGCDLVACRNALKVCDNDIGVAYEYLKLKSSAVNRRKCINGRWTPWTEKDYVTKAKKMYYG